MLSYLIILLCALVAWQCFAPLLICLSLLALDKLKLLSVLALLIPSIAFAADYPVAFLAHPRTTGGFATQSVSNLDGPYIFHPATDLVLANPDGTETVLVAGNVVDYCVSLDAKSILYSQVHDKACDIFRVTIATGEKTQLTDALNESFSTTGYILPKAPVWNTSPCENGDGSIVFTSNRESIKSPKESYRAFQLYRMGHDGKDVEKIGHFNLGGAAHPTITKSGKIYFSSAEQQGLRGGFGNVWGIWSINPDGTDWGPVLSVTGFTKTNGLGQGSSIDPFHFQAETTDGTTVIVHYYAPRIYGMLVAFPQFLATPFGPPTVFGDPLWHKNKGFMRGQTTNDGPTRSYLGFEPRGIYSPVPWTTSTDGEAWIGDPSKPCGMVSHPAAIPNNGIFLTWTGDEGDAKTNLGVYSIPDIKIPAASPEAMVKIVDKEDRHEWHGKPVVPFSAIYGIEKPPVPEAPKANLPPGSPFGVIGSSSTNWREITDQLSNNSPLDTPLFLAPDDDEIEYIRVLGFNPTTTYQGIFSPTAWAPVGSDARSHEGFFSQINERALILAEIPLKHYRTPDGSTYSGPNPPAGATRILDPLGEPDTSWAAIIPADTPWSLQLLDKYGRAIYGGTAQSWHQVRAGEQRTNCNGCHAHSQPTPFMFENTFAGSADYKLNRYEKLNLVEYYRDIKPIQDKYQLNWGPTPWDWTTVGKAYRSQRSTVDLSALTPEEKKTVYSWIDTGLMAAGTFATGERITPANQLGPFADLIPPTLTAKLYADKIVVGAFDAQSGLNKSSLSVKCDQPIAGRTAGEELADLFAHNATDWTWSLSTAVPESGRLSVSVRDNQTAKDGAGKVISESGNITVKTFALGGTGDSPPPDSDTEEIAKLKAEIAVLKAQVEALAAKVAAWEAWYKTGENN